jgi:2-polyprenyl-3-methyl-5-hydroxy-6-metoxy-1,4-benzoquinol methylase
MSDELGSRSKSPAWKKVWRFVFWPFYRHFDVLHSEIKELKQNLQSTRSVQDLALRDLHDAMQQSQQQASTLQATRGLLDELITRNADQDQRWLVRLAELQSRQDEFSGDAARRTDGISARMDRLTSEFSDMRSQSGDLAKGLDQLRLETRPRLHQLTLDLEQIRIKSSLAEQSLTAQLESAMTRILSQDEQWRSLATERSARLEASLEALAERVGESATQLNSVIQNLQSELHGMQGEVRDVSMGLERINDPVGKHFNYTAFENRFRGPEATIRKWQAIYIPLLRKHQPVVDLGCGRGELLEILKAEDIVATGVDNNKEQITRCRDKGLDVIDSEILEWLSSRSPESIGAITLLQVVEHLRLNEAQRLIAEASRALKPGGVLLMETVNPHCQEAMEWFYIDPTHLRPVYPEMLEFLFHEAGYRDIVIRFQNPSEANSTVEPPSPKTGADFSIWGIRP